MNTRVLYLGLEVPHDLEHNTVVHCPLIKIVPRPIDDRNIKAAFENLHAYTHVIFTSKSAVSIFMDYAAAKGIDGKAIQSKYLIAVGKMTAAKMAAQGIAATIIAEEEMAEGVVTVLEKLDLTNANVFWPHSALSRSVITDWLKDHNIQYCSFPLYDTVANIPKTLPDLDAIDEIVFTSPSTVDAFKAAFKELPEGKKLTCIGPVTKKAMMAR